MCQIIINNFKLIAKCISYVIANVYEISVSSDVYIIVQLSLFKPLFFCFAITV